MHCDKCVHTQICKQIHWLALLLIVVVRAGCGGNALERSKREDHKFETRLDYKEGGPEKHKENLVNYSSFVLFWKISSHYLKYYN